MTEPPISIALLGPVVIERGGLTVPGLGDRERAVLTALVLTERPFARGTLSALLWPDVPEAHARLSLRVALARLRPALPTRIRADRASVSFVPAEGDDVDVHAVRPILESVASQGDGLPDPAAVAAALARVRGPVAADLDRAGSPDFRAWLDAERAAFEALVARAAAWLAQGDAGVDDPARSGTPAGIEWLRAAVQRSPLDEALVRRLMVALGRAGAYADALAEYERLAVNLAAEIGLAPEPATEALRTRLEAAATRGRRHTLPAGRSGPGGAHNVERGSDERESDDRAHGAPASEEPRSDEFASDVRSPAVGAPTDARADRLAAWLADPDRRMLTVIGPAGTGRARLAMDAARRCVEHFMDGVVWVERSTSGRPGAAAFKDRVGAALSELDGAPIAAEAVGAWLAEKEILIVVDGLDSAEAASAAADITAWLQASPSLRCLVLAEAPLGIYYEHRFAASD